MHIVLDPIQKGACFYLKILVSKPQIVFFSLMTCFNPFLSFYDGRETTSLQKSVASNYIMLKGIIRPNAASMPGEICSQRPEPVKRDGVKFKQIVLSTVADIKGKGGCKLSDPCPKPLAMLRFCGRRGLSVVKANCSSSLRHLGL